jgi:stage II sporulation protein D
VVRPRPSAAEHPNLEAPFLPSTTRSFPRLAALLVAAVIGTVGAVVPAARASAADPVLPDGVTPLPASVTFTGRGYGHGVGMSQYGARGRALAGQDAATVLAHYYPGTTMATVPVSTPVRVLLLNRWTASRTVPLVIYGRGGTWTIDGISAVFPADGRLTLTPSIGATSTAWRLKVFAPDGALLYDAARSASFRVRPAEAATNLQLAPKPSTRNRYRGVLRVHQRSDGPTVSVVNEIKLDLYLRGVVPVEMPSTWPVEALRAQAIVARSYARRALRPGVSYFDVYDDTRSQAYHGLSGERAATNLAIRDTAGQVLKYGTSYANTVFHSTAGGHTEHNENVFVSSSGAKVAGAVPYLRGVPDLAPDGTSYDAAAPYANWTSTTWTSAQLSAWLAADSRTDVGTVLGLDLRNRGVSGRLISVTVYGTTGTKRVSGDVFRSVVNARKPGADKPIRSNLFELVVPAPPAAP